MLASNRIFCRSRWGQSGGTTLSPGSASQAGLPEASQGPTLQAGASTDKQPQLLLTEALWALPWLWASGLVGH